MCVAQASTAVLPGPCAAFAATRLAQLVAGGNLTLPVYEFQNYGDRGLAELDVWLAGNAT